jgi:arylsulfatase A-like enzyme
MNRTQRILLLAFALMLSGGCAKKQEAEPSAEADSGQADAKEEQPEIDRPPVQKARQLAAPAGSKQRAPDVTPGAKVSDRPNVLVIWGDDIGVHNISAYNHGIMGYQTPNIDSIAREGALFVHYYAQQSCTAGRAAFILGQHPFRTGLLTIGMPGSEHGAPDWAPTLGDLLKEKGYATGQFGKNHLGDRDKHLPTNHGFDEFYGNLYHLNAEEEPETYHYPKDPKFHERFGPRGVIHSFADGRIEDTGPLTRKRMETADDVTVGFAKDFIKRAHDEDKPFFVWLTTTRMHVHTRLKPESVGTSGEGLYPDGMVEHDGHVGEMLDLLNELGIQDNTIVVYSTDNGAETVTWPDGGITPFHGEKGTTWEGGMRVPAMVRWPGAIAPGTIINEIVSHEDWIPTIMAAVGEPDVKEKLKKGYSANGKTWKVHLDGYNYLPYFKGEAEVGPRNEILYFGQGGELNAVRYNKWKVNFAGIEGNIATGKRVVTNWPLIVNLHEDPYEMMPFESGEYIRWYIDQMWVMVPMQNVIKSFFKTIPDYPFQAGSSLSVSNVGYGTLQEKEALNRLKQMETIMLRQ